MAARRSGTGGSGGTARLESRVEALERLFENFLQEWRTDREELREAIRRQGQELSRSWREERQSLLDEVRKQSRDFHARVGELADQLSRRRETTRTLVAQWAGVAAMFLVMAGSLIIFATRSPILPLQTRLQSVEQEMARVRDVAGAARDLAVRLDERLRQPRHPAEPAQPDRR